jgi:hypothetical protein
MSICRFVVYVSWHNTIFTGDVSIQKGYVISRCFTQSAPHKPLSWFRFIDDVDMKWTESEENLDRFFDHANNVHPTIKLTHETSRNNISFLDTYTTCENGIMSTDIYNKPTDKHQYLSPQSCHPKHCTNSIPYSQVLRIIQLCVKSIRKCKQKSLYNQPKPYLFKKILWSHFWINFRNCLYFVCLFAHYVYMSGFYLYIIFPWFLIFRIYF